jgi:hypothetical protein
MYVRKGFIKDKGEKETERSILGREREREKVE